MGGTTFLGFDADDPDAAVDFGLGQVASEHVPERLRSLELLVLGVEQSEIASKISVGYKNCKPRSSSTDARHSAARSRQHRRVLHELPQGPVPSNNQIRGDMKRRVSKAW